MDRPSYEEAAPAPPLASRRDPDAHGQAALLAVESLIHGLIANGRLSVTEAVAIIDIACEVKVDFGIERRENTAVMAESLRLLNAMADSLRRELNR